MLLDGGELVVGEVQPPERAHVLLQLADAAGADEHGGHPRVAQRPGQGHLRQALPALPGDPVERAHVAERLLGEQVGRQRLALAGARALGDAVQVLAGEHPLGQRRERDAAGADVLEGVQQPLGLDPAVEHRVGRLVDQQRRPEVGEDLRRLGGVLRGVGRDADVEGLARLDGAVQRAHRLLQRRGRVGPVGVEDVDVLQAHPAQ